MTDSDEHLESIESQDFRSEHEPIPTKELRFVRPGHVSPISFYVQVLAVLFIKLVLVPIGIVNPPQIAEEYRYSPDYHRHPKDPPKSELQGTFVLAFCLVVAYCGFILLDRGTGTSELNLIVTFVVAAAGGFQALYMKRQWRIMSTQMQVSQRAWLVIDTPTTNPLSDESQINFKVWFRNIGTTPGFVSKSHAEIFDMPVGDELFESTVEYFLKTIPENRGVVLAPRSRSHVEPTSRDPIDVGRIIRGDTDLWMLAYIEYRDVFLQRRVSQALFRFEIATNRFSAWFMYNHMD